MTTANQTIEIPRVLTVKELGELMGVSPVEVIKELMKNGVMASINQVIDFDVTAHGDMLDWTFAVLRSRLAAMLEAAGGAELANRMDPRAAAPVLDEVEHATRAIAQRGVSGS